VPSSYLRAGIFGFRPVVTTVTFDSLAAKHGLQRGDIILSINGKEVKKSSELHQFTTGVLSVSIFRVNEKMTLSINRLSIEPPKINQIFAEKQTVTQRQITRDAAVAVVNPPVKIDNRASEKEHRRSLPATSTDAKLTKGMSSRPMSKEVADRTDQKSSPLSQELLTQGKQAHTKNEVAEKLPKKDFSGVPGESGPNLSAANASHTPAPQNDILTRQIKSTKDRIVLKSDKGNVIFSHSMHLRSFNKVQCLLCHQTENPTPEAIHSRLDNYRAVHGFCRGCHQKMGIGSLNKCHACHDYKNKN